jgi:benzoyl-CoA reductase/2-hydroxyglutaryl-CoA dehydratase subunit BcrC/BadD/HgdB
LRFYIFQRPANQGHAWAHLPSFACWPGRSLELSREAINLWTEIRELGTHRPSPLNVLDLFLAMAPIVVLRGTQKAVDFYRLMKAEVEQRIAEGVAA